MGMPEPLDVWLGKDEVEGVPSQPRKDLKPPPNWRLEAVAATERPRSLTMGADGRTAVFIQDRDTSDVWLLELDGDAGAPPQRLTTGRDPMPYWEDTEPRLSPDCSTVAYADQGSVWVVAAAGGPPRKLAEAGSPVWLGNDRLVVSVEREDTSRLAVLDVADAWPRRLCASGEGGDLEEYGDEWGAAVSPDGTAVAFVFTPRARPAQERDPHRRRRDRGGAGADRDRRGSPTRHPHGHPTARGSPSPRSAAAGTSST